MLALNILQTSATTLRQPSYMQTYAVPNYNDIIELGTPSLRSIKWLAVALLFASNYFGEQAIEELKKFLGGVLITRRSNEKSFLGVVLVQGLLELKNEAKIEEKLSEDFWKFLVDNTWMFSLVGNH
jgi:hypothetical protein